MAWNVIYEESDTWQYIIYAVTDSMYSIHIIDTMKTVYSSVDNAFS